MTEPSDTPPKVATAFLPFAPTPDRDSAPYWESLAKGDFTLQHCDKCGALRWPARALCNRCHSFEYTWQKADGLGHVVSWVRTHQVFAPALREAVPYIVVQVALEAQSDILLIGAWLADREPRSNENVEMEIIEGVEGFHFPCWRPAQP
jgi:uncharacterized OB-fold protein